MVKRKSKVKAKKAPVKSRKRSAASRKGWETRRQNQRDAALALALDSLITIFRTGEDAEDVRAGIRRRLRRKQYEETPQGRWEKWIDRARSIQPNLVVYVDPSAIEHDPNDPQVTLAFQVLTVFLSGVDPDDYERWLSSGTASENYRHFARTGLIKPSAQELEHGRFETKTHHRSGNAMLTGVFALDFANVEAVRVTARKAMPETKARVFVRAPTRWVKLSRAAARQRAEAKEKQK